MMEKRGSATEQRAPSRFASALVLLAAARCLRVGYKHWQNLDAFDAGRVSMVLALYIAAFALVIVALIGPPATFTSFLRANYQRLCSRMPQRTRARIATALIAITTFGAPAVTTLVLLRPILTGYKLDAVGSDGLLFAGRAVDGLLAGENPYALSMADAFGEHREIVPTYRIDGSPVTELSYPAMSVLAFVPQRLIGLVNLNLTSLLVLLVTMLWLVVRSPVELKWFPVLFLWADWSIASFSGGGVFDVLWVLPLLLAMDRFYRRHFTNAGIWFGIACCVKQTPWFIAPFALLALFGRDEPSRLRNAVRFVGASVLAFIVLNAPFVAVGPLAWLRGVLTPVAGGVSLVPLGTGPVMFELAGLINEPKIFFSLGMALCFAVTAIAYKMHAARLQALPWVAPMVVLWFNFRSPHNYFVFFPLVAYLAVLIRPPEATWVPARRPKLLPALAALCVMLWLGTGWALRDSTRLPVEVRLVSAQDPNDLGRVSGIAVDVTNRGGRPLEPLIALLSSKHATPVFWNANGPATIEAGATASYALAMPVPAAALERDGSARVVVYERGTEHHAGFVFEPSMLIPPRTLALSNPRFGLCAPAGKAHDVPFMWHANVSFTGDTRISCGAAGLTLEARDGGAITLHQLTRKRVGSLTLDVTPELRGETPDDQTGIGLYTKDHCVVVELGRADAQHATDADVDGRLCRVITLPATPGVRERQTLELATVIDPDLKRQIDAAEEEMTVRVFARGSAKATFHELRLMP